MLDTGNHVKGERSRRLMRLLRDGSSTRPGFPRGKGDAPNYEAAARAINKAAEGAAGADSSPDSPSVRPTVTGQYLRLLGTGRRTNPSADVIKLIADYFEVSPDDLIGSPGPPAEDGVRFVVVGEKSLSPAAHQAIADFVQAIVEAEESGMPLPQAPGVRTVPAKR